MPARIPSLDGLRAVSIAMVLICHGLATLPGWLQHAPRVWDLLGNGNRGVSVFFVISGFLITSLLLHEKEKTGSISLRNFYIRRAFRIVPPFYVFLLGVLVLWVSGAISMTPGGLFSSTFFLRDYVSAPDWWTGHSWSLSVEEQFYLLWPLALVLLGGKRARKLAIALIVAAPFIRVTSHAFLHNFGPREELMFHIRVDGLMVGCALALCRGTRLWNELAARGRWPALAGMAYLALVEPYLVERFHGFYRFPFGYSIEHAIIGMVMVYVVEYPSGWAGTVLNNRFVAHVGVISYSLYLWQQLFLTTLNHSWAGRFPINFVCCFLAAEASWVMVEKPALRWRQRFKRRPERAAPAVALSASASAS